MSHRNLTIEAFVKLGEFLRTFCEFIKSDSTSDAINNEWFLSFKDEIEMAQHYNGWFTVDNCMYAFEEWGNLLTKENIDNWLINYDINTNKEKIVALIMAGNIPLVGFHDLICVLITGNKALVKLSSNDQKLIPLLVRYLEDVAPYFKGRVIFTKEKLENYDAVIATGSNNTSRYFEYYFGKKPNIIRKNRNSVAVLTGEETNEDLTALGEDIFRYFGLGCRSVSKIFIPKDYNVDTFFKAIFSQNGIINHNKYANNYDYNKAVYLMSEFKILDNGFLILKEEESYGSPIASLFYEYYNDLEDLKYKLKQEEDKIQCIVSSGFIEREIEFGQTQKPTLKDYADAIDTVDFLLRTS
ncbi:acyl-CoA reductase [Maribacter hydrothermalis]|uniref:Acyl-CoA reductase n=1 Tax=Maribacter hydrothermalis TaxID=1836467 RepID=A0A1B7Z976_9FLAO|nr:acyl-CoA reductase [Maribacter hydrothermalis]APQ18867.1 acyl-CoA reductase [Maribacter hydrothermalis]OBR39120.1 acyl-CoA reductase [Maribacter hydrothermalis]